MFKIIDRFILNLFLKFFAIIFISCLTAILVFDSIESLAGSTQSEEVLLKALKVIPPTLELLLPYIGLLATMLTFGALYKHSEIMSIKAAGLSQVNIVRPIFIFSIIITAFLYLNQSYVVRYLGAESETITISEKNVGLDWFHNANNIVRVVAPKLVFGQIDLVEILNYDLTAKILSQAAYSDLTNQNGTWVAKNHTFSDFNDTQAAAGTKVDAQFDNFNLRELLSSPAYPSIYQPASQLIAAWRSETRGAYVSKLALIILLQKFSYLLSFIQLILLAVAFSESQVRSHKNLARIIAVTLIFYFFWFLDQFFFILAKEETIDIFSGTLMSNILLFAVTIYYLKAKRT